MLHVFAYDISSDRVRQRVSRLLESEGVRVQMSVFELRVSERRALGLGQEINKWLDRGDSLRIYPLNVGALGAVRVFGCGLPPETSEFVLV